MSQVFFYIRTFNHQVVLLFKDSGEPTSSNRQWSLRRPGLSGAGTLIR